MEPALSASAVPPPETSALQTNGVDLYDHPHYQLSPSPDFLGYIPEEPGYEEAVTSFSSSAAPTTPHPPPPSGSNNVAHIGRVTVEVEEDTTRFSSSSSSTSEVSQCDTGTSSPATRPKLLTFHSTSCEDDPCPLKFGQVSEDPVSRLNAQSPSTRSSIDLDSSRSLRFGQSVAEDSSAPKMNSEHSSSTRSSIDVGDSFSSSKFGTVSEDSVSYLNSQAPTTRSRTGCSSGSSSIDFENPRPLRFGTVMEDSSDTDTRLNSSSSTLVAPPSQFRSSDFEPRPLQIVLESETESRPVDRLASPQSDRGSDSSTTVGLPTGQAELSQTCPPRLQLVSPSSHTADNTEEESGDLVPQLTSRKGQRPRSRPGVILLGRGNSFSLGRSEVMLLHRGREPHPSHPSHTTSPPPPALSTSTTNNNNFNNDNGDHNHANDNDDNSGKKHVGVVTLNTLDPCEEELEQLWRGAEAIMSARCGAVHAVLQDFGVSQGEGAGEEELWGMIQARGSR